MSSVSPSSASPSSALSSTESSVSMQSFTTPSVPVGMFLLSADVARDPLSFAYAPSPSPSTLARLNRPYDASDSEGSVSESEG
jgi:hypothetical protein